MTRDLLRLAWPVFVGQVAVMLNGVIDTVMAGRLSAVDVAAIGLGSSVYISVYIGLMGVLLALSPIVAHHFGAGRFDQIGPDTHQAAWLALLLAVPGCVALAWSDLWLGLSDPPREVADVARIYLWATAAGLPAALLFRVFHALSSAIGNPKAVMAINLAALVLKAPLNALLMYGWSRGDTVLVPALGGAGCGVSTALLAWVSLLLAVATLHAQAVYRRLGVIGRGWLARPEPARLRGLLALGLPIGASHLVEVTSFTFMALFLAHLGATTAASHQIAANLAALVYMVPLALATATGVLVGQSIGAARPVEARQRALAGLRLALGCAAVTASVLFAARESLATLYSADRAVVAAAAPLIALIALFHFVDAAQSMCAFVLRAYRITTLPMVVFVVALWGVGLGGGWWLAFVVGASSHPWAGMVAGARGFWIATGLGVAAAAAALAAILARVWRAHDRAADRAQPGGASDRKRSR